LLARTGASHRADPGDGPSHPPRDLTRLDQPRPCPYLSSFGPVENRADWPGVCLSRGCSARCSTSPSAAPGFVPVTASGSALSQLMDRMPRRSKNSKKCKTLAQCRNHGNRLALRAECPVHTAQAEGLVVYHKSWLTSELGLLLDGALGTLCGRQCFRSRMTLGRVIHGTLGTRRNMIIAVQDCVAHESKSRDETVCSKPARLRSKALDLVFLSPERAAR